MVVFLVDDASAYVGLNVSAPVASTCGSGTYENTCAHCVENNAYRKFLKFPYVVHNITIEYGFCVPEVPDCSKVSSTEISVGAATSFYFLSVRGQLQQQIA